MERRPRSGEAYDSESKFMLKFLWNSQGFEVVDAMPCQRRDIHATYDIRYILTEIVARRGER
jgi:hypothetical protein